MQDTLTKVYVKRQEDIRMEVFVHREWKYFVLSVDVCEDAKPFLPFDRGFEWCVGGWETSAT
jgi:hypothetical protein